MYDASDRKDVRRAEKAAKFAEKARTEIVAGLMSSTSGRSWMYDLLAACHCFETSFTDSARVTAFREGERNIGLRLLGDIMSSCPDQYVQMMREANERAAAADRNYADDADGPDDAGRTEGWPDLNGSGGLEIIVDR